MTGVVERFLNAMPAHDWDGMAACLADDPFVRIGPYLDEYTSKAEYVDYIRVMLPTLSGYSMDVTRVTYGSGDGAGVAYAELSETVDDGGVPLRTPECLVFELDAAGLITRVEVFIQSK